MKDGGFPDAPSIPRDVPNDYYTSTDQPGARGNDTNYEAAVREERRVYESPLFQLNNNEGYVSEDDSTYILGHESYSYDDEDSSDDEYSKDVDGENLAFINSTLGERIDNPDNFLYDNDIPETAPEEAEMIPSPRQSRSSQDPIATAVLDPVLFTVQILDPEMLGLGQRIQRILVALRATLPSGYDASKIKIRVSPCRTKLLITLVKMDANYDAAYVLGEDLVGSSDGGALTSALAQALTISYTANGCGEEEKVFVINLPFKVEARGRNPATGWQKCPPNFAGYLTVCPQIHTSFFYVFYIQEEDSRLEQPSVLGGGLLNMTHQKQSSTLLPRQQQQSRMNVLDAFNNPPSPAFVTPPPPTNTHIHQPFGAYPRTLHRTPMDVDSTSSSGSFFEQTVPSTRPSATTTAAGASAMYDLQSSASLPPQVVYHSETPARSESFRQSMNPAKPQPEPIFRQGRRKKNRLSSNSSVASAASNNPRQKKYQAQAQMHQGTVEQQQQYEARLAWEEEQRRRMYQEEQQQQQQQQQQQYRQQHSRSAYNLRNRKPAPQGSSSSTAETAPPTVETVTSKDGDY